MPMIEIDRPDLLTRARGNIADITKVERSDQLFGLRMHSLALDCRAVCRRADQ